MNKSLAPSQTPTSGVQARAPFRWQNLLLRWELILVVMLVIVVLVNSRLTQYFWDQHNGASTGLRRQTHQQTR
jgi:hypothetical protein